MAHFKKIKIKTGYQSQFSMDSGLELKQVYYAQFVKISDMNPIVAVENNGRNFPVVLLDDINDLNGRNNELMDSSRILKNRTGALKIFVLGYNRDSNYPADYFGIIREFAEDIDIQISKHANPIKILKVADTSGYIVHDYVSGTRGFLNTTSNEYPQESETPAQVYKRGSVIGTRDSSIDAFLDEQLIPGMTLLGVQVGTTSRDSKPIFVPCLGYAETPKVMQPTPDLNLGDIIKNLSLPITRIDGGRAGFVVNPSGVYKPVLAPNCPDNMLLSPIAKVVAKQRKSYEIEIIQP